MTLNMFLQILLFKGNCACVKLYFDIFCVCFSRFHFHASKNDLDTLHRAEMPTICVEIKAICVFPLLLILFNFSFACLRDLLLLWFLRGNTSDSTGNNSAIEAVQLLHSWHKMRQNYYSVCIFLCVHCQEAPCKQLETPPENSTC